MRMGFLQELYEDCDKLRRTVIELATESEDNDSSLGKINRGLHVHITTSPQTGQNALQKHSARRVPAFLRVCGGKKHARGIQTWDFKLRLGDILQASDNLSHAVTSYKQIVDGQINGETEKPPQKHAPVRKGRFCLWSYVFVCFFWCQL